MNEKKEFKLLEEFRKNATEEDECTLFLEGLTEVALAARRQEKAEKTRRILNDNPWSFDSFVKLAEENLVEPDDPLLIQLWNKVSGSAFIQRSHGIADFVWNAPAQLLKLLQDIVVPVDTSVPHPCMLGGGIYRGSDEQRKEEKGEDEQIKKDIYLEFNEILKREGITWYPIHESISEENFLVIGLRHRDKKDFKKEKNDNISPPEIILQTEGFDADSWKIDYRRWSDNWLRVDIKHENVISLDAVKIKVRGDSDDSRITLILEQDPS